MFSITLPAADLLIPCVVASDEAGPSGGLIRRPRETAGDIAEIYARLREVEDNTEGLARATAVRMEEIKSDVGRVDSNQETKAKYFKQQLERVEGVANAALERTTGLQDQVNSVRQQTHDLHESLSVMNRHQEVLTTGLTGTIQGLQGFQFQIPTLFDDWLKVKTGGYPLTINSQQIEHPWIAPYVPPAPAHLGPIQDAIPTQSGAGPAGHDMEQGTSSSSSGPSAGTLFRQFMVSSQENLPLQNKSDGEDEPSTGDAGMEATVVDLVDAEAAVAAEAEDMQMEDTDGEGIGEVEAEAEADSDSANAAEDGEAMHTEVQTSEGVAGVEATVVDLVDAEAEDMQMEDKGADSTDGAEAEAEVEAEADATSASQLEGGEAMHTEVQTTEGEAGAEAEEDEQAAEEDGQAADRPRAEHGAPDNGEDMADTLVQHEDTTSAEAETGGEDRRTPSPFHVMDNAEAASAPSPISPYIIQSEEVNPPPGLLATGIHISPASSQPMSSPTPHRNARLLRVEPHPSNRPSGPTTRSRSQSPNLLQSEDIPAGPMTRSRSRSRSPHPPAPLNRSEKPIMNPRRRRG